MSTGLGVPRSVRSLPEPLARRFEAIVFDWDGTAVADRQVDGGRVRRLVETACHAGLELAIVSGTHLGNVDGQLGARPAGPGGLVLLLNRGSEVFQVGRDGPALVERRTATAEEDAALTRAARLTIARLKARGLSARVVSERLNRRKIDLIPEPAWSDPPKARIGELLAAVEARLAAAGIGGLPEAVAIAEQAATTAGLAHPRVTSDAKHVEIGLTDKTDSARWIMGALWDRGVAPGQVLVVGDELGPLGGLPGSDSYVLAPWERPVTAVSVGAEPGGVPDGVLLLGGGPEAFASLLEDQIRRRRRREVPVIDVDPAWTLAVAGVNPLLERVDESLLTLADGRLGTRGSLVTEDSRDDPSVLTSGVYASEGAETHLLPGPRWNVLDLAGRTVESPRRLLDLRTGILTQEFATDGGWLRAVLLSSLARPATTALRAEGHRTDPPGSPGLRPPSGDSAVRSGSSAGCSWMRVGERPASVVAASHEDVDGDARHWSLDRITCFDGSSAGVAEERTALDRLGAERAAGFDGLLAEHRRAWALRWNDADVRIDGDSELQLAVRFALFHLIASVADEGEAAVGARGLTGHAYRGHVFWDSDVYVLPFLAATHPSAARAMLEYRRRRLPAALEAARARGNAGARFAWESAASGEDVTPHSARDRRGRLSTIVTGELEEHVVADVAWAVSHYIDWSADHAFAEGPGLELLVQTARWWASRIEVDADGSAHIRGVMGPDEYHPRVDDNAYTNVMARWNLRRAAAAAPAGAIEEAERRRWHEFADALVDGYDPATGLYEQFAGFWELEPLVISELAPQRPVAADLLLGEARTRGAQVVKQPDVLMLHHLVPEELAPGSLGPNLDFYDPRTAHGSTLSPGVHASLLARAGRLGEALELLRLTSRIDLRDLGQNTAGGVHLAAMGSLWRAVCLGLGGLRPDGDGLAIAPVAAPGLDAVEIRVRFRGRRVRLRITPDGAEVSATPSVVVAASGHPPVEVGAAVRTFELWAGET